MLLHPHRNRLSFPSSRIKYPIGRFLEYMEDPGGSLTIDDVISPAYAGKFVPSQKEILNFGATDSAYWVRFRVRSMADTEKKYIL